jgi:hypothetical protein
MINRGGVPFTQWFAVGAYTAQGNNPNFYLNQQFAPPGQAYTGLWRYQELRDPSVFNFYDTLLDGPNKRENSGFRALNATFRQTFFRDLVGFEFAYDQQKHKRDNFGMFGFDAYTIFVDMQSKLVDGAANPNFGRPYVASDSIGNNFVDSEREAYRATAYATLDLRRRAACSGTSAATSSPAPTPTSATTTSAAPSTATRTASTSTSTPTTPPPRRIRPTPPSTTSGPRSRISPRPGANISGISAVHPAGKRHGPDLRRPHQPDGPRSGHRHQRQRTRHQQALLRREQEFQPHQEQVRGVAELPVHRKARRPRRLARGRVRSPRRRPRAPRLRHRRDRPLQPAWVLPATPTIYAKDSTISWSGVLHAPNFVKRWLPRGSDLSVSYNEAKNFRPSSTIADVYGRPFSAALRQDQGHRRHDLRARP